jgi:deoxycytidylate deaminase
VAGRPPSKTCTRCGIKKPLTEFYRDRRRKDGYRPSCKKCFGRSVERIRDAEKNAAYMRRWRAARDEKLARPGWDETWGVLAVAMSYRSRCARNKIGAVIVSAENVVVATGYNGPPSGWIYAETESCLDWCERARAGDTDPSYFNCPSNHAEMNALVRSSWADRVGGTIYITGAACMSCAKAIANSGLAAVAHVNVDYEKDAYREPDKVREFLADCGLVVTDVSVDA